MLMDLVIISVSVSFLDNRYLHIRSLIFLFASSFFHRSILFKVNIGRSGNEEVRFLVLL